LILILKKKVFDFELNKWWRNPLICFGIIDHFVSLRLCLGVWRGREGKVLGVRNIGENEKIFYIF